MEPEDWNRRYDGPDLVWTAEPNRILVSEVEPMAPAHALDLGCGEGRNAVWLAKQGWSVTGVDFSDVGLAKARRLAEAEGVSAEWVSADLRDYQPEESAFDLVVVLYLHLPPGERRAVHTTAATAVRPRGTLLVVGHDLTNLSEGYGGPQDPSILFTPDDLAGDVPGLTIVKAERVRRQVSTDAGERTAIDAVLRAERRPSAPSVQPAEAARPAPRRGRPTTVRV
ncbi:MAG: class I SAM-dependent methyltransferase [Actinobacteria bacterium]|nr:MAG: class I SAM-dependent methyltransferase [Actinomycetota bacterium]